MTHSEVKEMLKEALQERSDNVLHFDIHKEEFNIHLEIADLTTIHEAYQYLVKKYVDGNEDSTPEVFVNIDEIKKRHDEIKKKHDENKNKKNDADLVDKRDNSPMDANRKSR